MTIFFIIIFSVFSILLSKKIFSHWVNPISVYSVIWVGMLSLYELKLMPFYSLTTFTWVVVIGAFISFVFGIITIYIWHNRFNGITGNVTENGINTFFFDEGKTIRNLILIFSIIGIIGSLQHWYVLIGIFGSVKNVLINAIKVYQMRQKGEPKGIWPYIWLFSFFATFLAGIYSAYKGKISPIVILPIIGIILKDAAKVARNGVLLGLFEFIFSYLFFSYYLRKTGVLKKKKLNTKKIVGLIVIFSLMVFAVSLIKALRTTDEKKYSVAKSELAQTKGGFVISPQIYFYAAGQVGVLNKYIMSGAEEHRPFAANTFKPIYSFLGKLGLVEKVDYKLKGYLIPLWSNTATYLRDLINDYGIVGPFLFPFLLGMLIAYLWYKFMITGKLKILLLLTHFSMVIGMSFFILALTMGPVIYGILFMYPFLVWFEKFMLRKKYFSQSNSILVSISDEK